MMEADAQPTGYELSPYGPEYRCIDTRTAAFFAIQRLVGMYIISMTYAPEDLDFFDYLDLLMPRSVAPDFLRWLSLGGVLDLHERVPNTDFEKLQHALLNIHRHDIAYECSALHAVSADTGLVLRVHDIYQSTTVPVQIDLSEATISEIATRHNFAAEAASYRTVMVQVFAQFRAFHTQHTRDAVRLRLMDCMSAWNTSTFHIHASDDELYELMYGHDAPEVDRGLRPISNMLRVPEQGNYGIGETAFGLPVGGVKELCDLSHVRNWLIPETSELLPHPYTKEKMARVREVARLGQSRIPRGLYSMPIMPCVLEAMVYACMTGDEYTRPPIKLDNVAAYTIFCSFEYYFLVEYVTYSLESTMLVASAPPLFYWTMPSPVSSGMSFVALLISLLVRNQTRINFGFVLNFLRAMTYYEVARINVARQKDPNKEHYQGYFAHEIKVAPDIGEYDYPIMPSAPFDTVLSYVVRWATIFPLMMSRPKRFFTHEEELDCSPCAVLRAVYEVETLCVPRKVHPTTGREYANRMGEVMSEIVLANNRGMLTNTPSMPCCRLEHSARPANTLPFHINAVGCDILVCVADAWINQTYLVNESALRASGFTVEQYRYFATLQLRRLASDLIRRHRAHTAQLMPSKWPVHACSPSIDATQYPQYHPLVTVMSMAPHQLFGETVVDKWLWIRDHFFLFRQTPLSCTMDKVDDDSVVDRRERERQSSMHKDDTWSHWIGYRPEMFPSKFLQTIPERRNKLVDPLTALFYSGPELELNDALFGIAVLRSVGFDNIRLCKACKDPRWWNIESTPLTGLMSHIGVNSARFMALLDAWCFIPLYLPKKSFTPDHAPTFASNRFAHECVIGHGIRLGQVVRVLRDERMLAHRLHDAQSAQLTKKEHWDASFENTCERAAAVKVLVAAHEWHNSITFMQPEPDEATLGPYVFMPVLQPPPLIDHRVSVRVRLGPRKWILTTSDIAEINDEMVVRETLGPDYMGRGLETTTILVDPRAAATPDLRRAADITQILHERDRVVIGTFNACFKPPCRYAPEERTPMCIERKDKQLVLTPVKWIDESLGSSACQHRKLHKGPTSDATNMLAYCVGTDRFAGDHIVSIGKNAAIAYTKSFFEFVCGTREQYAQLSAPELCKLLCMIHPVGYAACISIPRLVEAGVVHAPALNDEPPEEDLKCRMVEWVLLRALTWPRHASVRSVMVAIQSVPGGFRFPGAIPRNLQGAMTGCSLRIETRLRKLTSLIGAPLAS